MVIKPFQCLTEVSITGLLITLIGLLLQFSPLHASPFLNMGVPVTLVGNCVEKENKRTEKMSLSKSVQTAKIATIVLYIILKDLGFSNLFV